MEGFLPLPMVPQPIILPFWFPPKPTMPPGLSSRLWNISLSPVMCREQPLSRYHDWCLRGAVKDICNINNFVLRYPSSGSFWVSFTRSSGNLWCSSLWIFQWDLSMRFCKTRFVYIILLFINNMRFLFVLQ